ncbi:MAG: TIM-barrel domain-containing protein [bacterium]
MEKRRFFFIQPLIISFLIFVLAPNIVSAAIKREGQKVIVGDARFTVISPTLIRLEYSPEGKFVDEPSILVQNRDWGKVDYQVSEEKGWLVLKTRIMTLRYLLGSGAFNRGNLSISWRIGNNEMVWHPGDKDEQNLGGTVAALDGVSRDNLPPFPPGILSRSGYFFLDDTPHPLWDAKDKWWKPRPSTSQQDWYFFCYGHNYPLALSEYTRLTGSIPMLPRYAFGAWYSRYWPYSEIEEREIINTFRQKKIPLDVLVIDVDWHLYGWESYDWNPQYFPRPEEFIDWCHKQGIKVTLNTHPGTPIPAQDSHFKDFCKVLGVDPEGRQSVGYNLANKRDAEAFGNVLLCSVLKQGVDFLWIDGAGASAPGIDHFAWTNKVYYETEQNFTGKRALIFGRQGLVGSGTHRYPVGFSGDTFSQWEVLRYEIPFTVKGGNVGIYWSHDIGGFHGDKLPDELYVRWVQFGAFSPILRLHSNHGRRLPWDYSPEAEEIVKKYFQIRYSLFPYIYSVSRIVHDTGVPLCRGLYIHYPELNEAYKYEYEYMFGPNILVAPIDQPAKNGYAIKEIYLPPGIWYDFFKNKVYKGPRRLIYRAKLEEMPVFAKAGAIIPMQPEMQYIGEKPVDPLILKIYAGANGEFNLYEDDGLSLDYLKGRFATTRIVYREKEQDIFLTIGAAKGEYAGQLANRSYVVEINGVPNPEEVKIDGKVLRKGSEWFYDPKLMRLDIKTPRYSIRKEIKVSVKVSNRINEAIAINSDLSELSQIVYSLGDYFSYLSPLAQVGLTELNVTADVAREKLSLGDLASARKRLEIGREIYNKFIEALWEMPESEVKNKILKEALGINLQLSNEDFKVRFNLSLSGEKSLKMVRISVEKGEDGWEIVGKREYVFMGGKTPTEGSFEARWKGKFLPLGGFTGSVNALIEFSPDKILQTSERWLIDCSYVQAFRLFGVYDNTNNQGMEKSYPPEEWLGKGIPTNLMDVEEKRSRWSIPRIDESTGSAPVYIDLTEYFGRRNNVVAYAFTYVYSPEETDAQILLGSDDGCVLWLNGERIYAYLSPRVAKPDEDKVPVHLKKGWNEVVLKIGQLGGDWGFYLRILGKDGKPISGLLDWYEPM